MFSAKKLQKSFINLFLIFTFLFNGIISANAQGEFVTSGKIGGNSSVFVFRTASKAKKTNYAAKRETKVKRTVKQRRVTRRTMVVQTKVVAKKNRVRRNIKVVTPNELKQIDVTRQTPKEASKVLAGAGEYFVERDEFDKAVGYLEQAVELDPNNNDAKLALSETYTTIGNQTIEKAEEFGELAAKALQEKRTADVEKYLTQEHFAYKKAEKEFIRALELDPKNSTAYASLGQYYDDKENVEKAKANYEKAIELDPTLSNVKAPLGIIYYQEGLIDKAEKLFSEAMADGVENAETQYFLGLILYKKQNQDVESQKALERSIAFDDDNAEAHYYLGAVSGRLGEEEKAIVSFKKATSLDASFVLAWFDLGVAYYNKGLYEQAIEAFDNAIKLNRNQTAEEKRVYNESYENLAETYRQTEQYDLAIPKYRVAVSKITDDSELFSSFAFVLAEKKYWTEAIKTFDKATKIKGDAVTFANLGWAYYQESLVHAEWNRISQQKESLLNAKAALQASVNLNSDFVPALLNLGATLNDLGEAGEAIRVLEKTIELKKDWDMAEYALGVAYRKNGNLDKAVKQFKKAINIDKNFAFAYYSLGETEYQRGKRKEANEALSKLKKLDTKLAQKLEGTFAKSVF